MTTKNKNLVLVWVMAAVLFALALWCWFKPADAVSESERRPLAQIPAVTLDSILSGDFASDFDSYTLDQFPLRDTFRTMKALMEYTAFGRLDSNGIYVVDGYVSKLEYPLNETLVDNAAAHFEKIYDKYIAPAGCNVYVSLVPDKNYFMAEANGYPTMDYDGMVASLTSQMDYAEYIDIFPLLSLEDYYRTDTHWRQENICGVAQALAEAMGTQISASYISRPLDKPFYGVYYGQSALPLLPDSIYYLTNSAIDGCTVISYDTGMPVEIPMYDLSAADGEDPYEMYLGGSDALLVVENPNAATDRELIVFRDSFAGSLIPLMAEGYAKITLVDTRYIHSDWLGSFIDFNGQDVLFIYSTLIINNSSAFK